MERRTYDGIMTRSPTALSFIYILVLALIASVNAQTTACSSILVQSGDTCTSIADRCGITIREFQEYNIGICFPAANSFFLGSGNPVCCSTGSLVLAPQQGSDGLCYTYVVQDGDNCYQIEQAYEMTTGDIEKYNVDTEEWAGCDYMEIGIEICLSPGSLTTVSAASSSSSCDCTSVSSSFSIESTLAIQPSTTTEDIFTVQTADAMPSSITLASGSTIISRSSSISSFLTSLASHSTLSTVAIASSSSFSSSPTVSLSPSHSLSTSSSSSSLSTSPVSTSAASSISTTYTGSSSTSTHSTSTTDSPSTSKSTSTTQSTSSSTSTTHSTSIMSLSSTKTTSTSTKTSSTSSPTETGGRWSLLIFAKEKCKGDYYYVSGTTTGCVNLHGDMTTTVADDEMLYCKYVSTDGSWTACADGPLETPGSWGFTDAVCNVFTTSDCTDPDNTSQTFTSVGQGECQAYGDLTLPEIKWSSVQCKDVIDAYNE